MNQPLPLIAGILGILFLAVAALFPTGSLASFFPGFEAGDAHIHVRHAIVTFIIALVLFAFAWFQGNRERL